LGYSASLGHGWSDVSYEDWGWDKDPETGRETGCVYGVVWCAERVWYTYQLAAASGKPS